MVQVEGIYDEANLETMLQNERANLQVIHSAMSIQSAPSELRLFGIPVDANVRYGRP